MEYPFTARWFFSLRFAFFIFTALSCSGGVLESDPINLPVPFSGALTGDSQVVVVDGGPVSSNGSLILQAASKGLQAASCTNFPALDTDGNVAGNCVYCSGDPISSEAIEEGRLDRFSMPVVCQMNSGDIFPANVDCFDYPHSDPTIQLSGLVSDPAAELRKGLCAGYILENSVPTSATMVGKYVTISKNEAGTKIFFQHLKWVWTMEDVLVQKPASTGAGDFLAVMFENNFPINEIPGGVSTLLFCEGRTDASGNLVPCGIVKYTEADFIKLDPTIADVFFTTEVCQCTLPSDRYEEATASCADFATSLPSSAPPECVKITNAHFIENLVPGIVYPDGVPFAATMTEHDPIDCSQTSGVFQEACLSGGLKLDYRCQAILQFDEEGNLVKFSRSIGGAYVISLP